MISEAALFIDVEPRDVVLGMCAALAPGSKARLVLDVAKKPSLHGQCPSFVAVVMAMLEFESDKSTVILHNLVAQRPFGRN